MMFSRRCAPRCPNTNMRYHWLLKTKVPGRITRRCCDRSLCNSAPASPGGPQAVQGGLLLLLLLGVGLLWALL